MKPHTFQYDYKPLLNGQICQMVKSALAEDLHKIVEYRDNYFTGDF